MFKGALHIHSTYSDGEFSIPELRRIYLDAGCRFACVTDHADWFEADRLDAYREECLEQSDDRFLFIPGLEYPCVDRMHIVGYGTTAPIRTPEPSEVIREIRRQQGIAVIAHPKDAHFPLIERLDALPHGLEVWNSKYDGRYAPRPETFALLRRLQARDPATLAFYGQDLHWKMQYRGLFVQVDAPLLTRDVIMAALRSGAFHAEKDGLTLPSSGDVATATLGGMARAHRRSQTMRTLLKTAKRAAERLGLTVPGKLKAHARRVM